jgi:hypothetical protein
LTDWLSITAADGLASRPARSASSAKMIVCAPAITAVIVALAIAAPEQVGASYPLPLGAIALT